MTIAAISNSKNYAVNNYLIKKSNYRLIQLFIWIRYFTFVNSNILILYTISLNDTLSVLLNILVCIYSFTSLFL